MFQLHLFEQSASEKGIQAGQCYLPSLDFVYIPIPYQNDDFRVTPCVRQLRAREYLRCSEIFLSSSFLGAEMKL